jgi:hypothetical protein
MNRATGPSGSVGRTFNAPEEASEEQPGTGRTTGKSQLQTTSCHSAPTRNRAMDFSEEVSSASSLAVAADVRTRLR